MTNGERADFLLEQARCEYKDMQRSLKEHNWNRAIRNAQECVELSLKGILKLVNVEFPKEHDIGKYFVDVLVRARRVPISPEDAEHIAKASAYLADKRAPSYYGEQFYSEKDARIAEQEAKYVAVFVRNLLRQIGPRQK